MTTLHRIREARIAEEISPRTLAERLGVSLGELAEQERPDCDMTISELQRWAIAMEVPVASLLSADVGEHQLGDRAAIINAAKGAAWIFMKAHTKDIRRMACNVLDELNRAIPGVANVDPWTEGKGLRRTLDEPSRRDETQIRLADVPEFDISQFETERI